MVVAYRRSRGQQQVQDEGEPQARYRPENFSEHELQRLTERRTQLLERPHIAARRTRQQRPDSVESDLRLVGQRRFSMAVLLRRCRQIGNAHFAPECPRQLEQRPTFVRRYQVARNCRPLPR